MVEAHLCHLKNVQMYWQLGIKPHVQVSDDSHVYCLNCFKDSHMVMKNTTFSYLTCNS